MSKDTSFLLQAIAVGALIPFAYDWLRILRRILPHKQLVVALQDLFFWVICGISVFLWMYRVRGGGLRWFAIAGALTGMCLYKKLFSELLVTYLAKLMSLLLKLLRKLLFLLTYPLRAVGRRMNKAGRKIGNCRRKILENFKIWLKSKLKALTIRLKKK